MFFESLKEYEGMKPGLSRIKKFFDMTGNPQNKLNCVHIAGTNGKGSTAAFLEAVLRENGYKTALYTSPHLADITERIKVNGKSIPKNEFNAIAGKYIKYARQCRLSYFEYLTAIAFMYFAGQKTDIAVIETGLGGRFDATNVIEKPLVSVITSISLDHCEILGNTVEKIAFEKAGIIKKGTFAVCSEVPPKALKVIQDKALGVSGRLFVLGGDFFVKHASGSKFDYRGIGREINGIKIPLAGRHQLNNAASALCAVELLAKSGYVFEDKKIKKALSRAVWAARFDVRKVTLNGKKFELVIDGAHNEEGIDAFIETWNSQKYSEKKRSFIFAAMKEKDYNGTVKKVACLADRVILPDLKNPRAVPQSVLKAEFIKYIGENKVYCAGSAKEALDMIKSRDKAAAIGSLYLAGEILKNIKRGKKCQNNNFISG
ncbi:MAG: bifunctional folylpolyglutamate synthase/dihydrofolate synthase [Endomicrobium sp.]|jgi:dihydrofolate synthase/folylpolyglutamate synthase|nr:bifunctional folylpolyglutamate synthase/dihydrofolate synthase [Endomicrobium sp.]